MVSWLLRGAALVLVGIDVFLAPLGPVARPLTVAAYLACGLLLAGCAVLEHRGTRDGRLPVALGLIAALSAAASVQQDLNSLLALAAIAVIDAGTEPRLAAGWGVFGAGVVAVAFGALAAGTGAEKAVELCLILALALLMGFNRRAYRVRAEQNAALLAQAEQLRTEQRRTAVLDERARLAREIHDVLAHSLGALGIQIQAARALLEGSAGAERVGRADDVLAVAQRMASDGLTETRRAVHALRGDRLSLGEELGAMAAAHEERHGTPVAVDVTGGPVPLPPDQTLALVRTAQESLVNAAKHAPHRPVTLRLSYRDEDVTMSITNPLGPPGDGTGAAAGTEDSGARLATVDGGYGLTGMRERLLLLGGTLTAGCADGRSWTVTARVPR
ncbi:sensor histidine kinase [Actinacidiphila acididurans]|nr:histidine kinase [Actinacidiphila acididurans]